MICAVCNSSEFALIDGVNFCRECNTEVQGYREEESEGYGLNKKTYLKSPSVRTKQKEKSEAPYLTLWTTTEGYNLILCKQVFVLESLGASKKLKDVVFCIWARYLQKCEVAFRNDSLAQENTPHLSILPRSRDVWICYGEKVAAKLFNGFGKKYSKVEKRQTRKVRSKAKETGMAKETISDAENEWTDFDVGQESEEKALEASCNTDADNHSAFEDKPIRFSSFADKKLCQVPTSSKMKKYHLGNSRVHHMNLSKTLCFCYLGLLYTGDQLLLSDLLRFANQGVLPYLNATDVFPPSMLIEYDDHGIFTKKYAAQAQAISLMCTKIIQFLDLPKFKQPSVMSIVFRFIRDLNLPDRLLPVAYSLLKKLSFDKNEEWYIPKKGAFGITASIPLYDVQAMALILVALKVIYVLDDEYEIKHSAVVSKINVFLNEPKLFVWSEWKQQLSLKEFLFMKSDKSKFSTMDSLSAERLVSNHPYRHLRETTAIRKINRHYRARDEVKNILNELTGISAASFAKRQSSFPLKYELKDLMENWGSFSFYKEINDIDFTFISKDFSSCLLQFDDVQAPLGSKETVENLFMSLNDSTYEGSESPNYWVKHLKTYNKRFVEQLPSTFRWLLSVFSRKIQCKPQLIYDQVMRIEKELVLKKK